MNRTRTEIGQAREGQSSPSGGPSLPKAGPAIAMLLQNNPYPRDVRVRREAESLAAAGYRVRVWAPRAPGEPRREVVRAVEARRFRVPQARGSVTSFLAEYLVSALALNMAALRELFRGARILHLHNPPDILFPAALVFRLAGRRVIFDSHDLFPELVAAKFGSRLLERLARACERATFALADHVLAANESHAEVAQQRGHKPPQSITIVRNGPLTESVAPSAPHRSGALSDPLIVYVGAISSQDGVEALAPVMAILAGDHGLVGARLRIVGDGESRDALERALATEEVDDRVEMTGWVELERVPDLLRDADICVDPAPPTPLNQRSTMIKIAEYMAAGRPVVAYDLLETRRTLGDAGMLASEHTPSGLATAIAELAADGERRERLGQKGLARVRALSWERSESALLDAYSQLAA